MKEVYNHYKDKYSTTNNFNEREFQLYKKYLKIIIDKVPKVKDNLNSMLDLGCGSGIKTQAFATYFNTCTAIDFSPSAIELAIKLNQQKNLKFYQADINDIENDDFSCITALGFSYFNVEDNKILVNRINEVFNKFTNDKGCLVISSFTDFSGNSESGWFKHSKDQLSNLKTQLNDAGFNVEYIFPYKLKMNYLNFGFKNLFLEIGKRLLIKKKTFFIVVSK